MDYSEACKENLKRANKELALWNSLEGIPENDVTGKIQLDLKRIPIVAKDVNDHEHPYLSTTKTYLICSNGHWSLGHFRRNYSNSGWEFRKDGYSDSLSNISLIYEINLPFIAKELIPRVKMKAKTKETVIYDTEVYGCECNNDVCTCYND